MSTLEHVNRDGVIRWASSSPFLDDGEQVDSTKSPLPKRIAVVGLSDKPDRPSHRVSDALMKMGYEIVPVNPTCERVLGERCYPDLRSIPGSIHIVQVFRRPEHVPAIAREAAAERARLGIRVLWLQEGVVSDEAAQIALAAGIDVVMDRCLYKEIVRLQG